MRVERKLPNFVVVANT